MADEIQEISFDAKYSDSTGKRICVGDRVRWRGQEYTIKSFLPGMGRHDEFAGIEFEEKRHLAEQPDEWAVDKL